MVAYECRKGIAVILHRLLEILEPLSNECLGESLEAELSGTDLLPYWEDPVIELRPD